MGVKYVVVKGGYCLVGEKVLDLFYDGYIVYFLENELYFIDYNYGVGCIFLVVIIVGLVKGYLVLEVVILVKKFVVVVIKYGI